MLFIGSYLFWLFLFWPLSLTGLLAILIALHHHSGEMPPAMRRGLIYEKLFYLSAFIVILIFGVVITSFGEADRYPLRNVANFLHLSIPLHSIVFIVYSLRLDGDYAVTRFWSALASAYFCYEATLTLQMIVYDAFP